MTVKLGKALARRLQKAVRRRRVTKSEWLREAIEARLAEEGSEDSFLDRARDLAGCVRGRPSDLSSSRKHLKGFGK
jgi:Arc/MetJ-type ribon-helix-helix transcriptional regulator